MGMPRDVRYALRLGTPFAEASEPSVAVVLFGVVGAGLVLITLLGNSVLPKAHDMSDESAFLTYAHNLLHGQYAKSSDQELGGYLWHGPGLPILLVAPVALHLPIQVIRLIGPAALLASGFLLYRILRPYVGWRVALVGGGILAAFPPFWRLLPQLFTEPVALVCSLIGAWALTRSARPRGWRWSALAGLAFGWVVLTRPEYGYVLLASLVVVAAACALKRYRRAAIPIVISLGVAFAVCIPWLAYTYSLSHRLFYFASSGGDSLYWMTSTLPGDTGDWQSSDDVRTNPHLASLRPLWNTLYAMPQVQRVEKEQTLAVKAIEAHPGVYAEHVLDNLGRMLIDEPFSWQPWSKGRLFFYGLPTLLILALGALGGWRYWRNRRGPPAALGYLLFLSIASLILHLPASADPRMLTLGIPGVIALGLAGLVASRPRVPVIAVGCVARVASNLP